MTKLWVFKLINYDKEKNIDEYKEKMFLYKNKLCIIVFFFPIF